MFPYFLVNLERAFISVGSSIFAHCSLSSTSWPLLSSHIKAPFAKEIWNFRHFISILRCFAIHDLYHQVRKMNAVSNAFAEFTPFLMRFPQLLQLFKHIFIKMEFGNCNLYR